MAIFTPNGWYLNIYPIGGGTLGFGSGGFDQATVPAHTFDYEDLVATLQEKASVSHQNSDTKYCGVNFRPADGAAAVVRTIGDYRFVRRLFTKAREAAQFLPGQRLNEIWETNAPATQP